MLILLPPSETKRPGGSSTYTPAELHDDSTFGGVRARVRVALEQLSADEEAAARALKLGVKSRGALAHNRSLASSGALPAIERYTGVLYDALGVETLDPRAREWIDDHVMVQSALFGLVSAADLIPAYRLSASSRLPGLGASLKRVWADAHRERDWGGSLILDLRSNDYAALAPLPEGIGTVVHVVHRDENGDMRALNHFNKAAKGDLVRRLARSSANIESVAELVSWARDAGLEMTHGVDAGQVTLVSDRLVG